MKRHLKLTGAALLMAGAALGIQPLQAQGGYVAGDFHQHTTYTDGSYTIGKMMEMIQQKGMDANEALQKATGQYGRFDNAAKYIDPRKE